MLDPRRPGPDYTLRWPPELFVREAQYFADQPQTAGWADRVGLLLQEAFLSNTPFDEHQQTANLSGPSWKVTDAITDLAVKKSLTQLIAAAPRMPQESTPPRPYYSSRTRTGTAVKSPDLAGAQRS